MSHEQENGRTGSQPRSGSRGPDAPRGAGQHQSGQRGGQRSQQPSGGTGQNRTGTAGSSRGTPQKRGDAAVPTGLRAVSVALAVFGLPAVYAGIKLLQVSGEASRYDPTGSSSSLGVVGALALAVGVGYLAAAYGTWTFKPWGWKLGVGLFAVGTLSGLLLLAEGAGAAGLVGLAVNGGLGWYLYTNRPLYVQFVEDGRYSSQ